MQTILIVDDDSGIRALYTSELEEEGFLTFAAKSCEEALKILGKRKVDLVTLVLSFAANKSPCDVPPLRPKQQAADPEFRK